jgi:7-cyano-7-deazaguanine synthase in queuosine biosynthesis
VNWNVICQVGAGDDFAPDVSAPLIVALGKPGSRYAVGSNVVKELYGRGYELRDVDIDLLHLATAVYTADVRIQRRLSADGWTRNLTLHLPVAEPGRWEGALPVITNMLSFLTGDRWAVSLRRRLEFDRPARKSVPEVIPAAVSLFSGGLDSYAGAVELIEEREDLIALVGQYGKGSTSSAQTNSYKVIANEYAGRTTRFGFYVQPAKLKGQAAEDTQRARSILFLALGTTVASACGEGTTLFVPEKGLISLNVPLTHSRIGSLSTKTTHPYFVSLYKEMLAALGINVPVVLPYRFATKGEMLKNIKSRKALRIGLPKTVSCSRPDAGRFQGRPPGTHCGYCVPCLIRLSSMKAAGISTDGAAYFDVLDERPNPDTTKGIDVRAFEIGVERIRALKPLELVAQVLHSGPLPPGEIQENVDTYKRGMEEVGRFLRVGRK